MIHYINQEQIKAYRENPAISQSQLKIEKYEKEEKEKEIKNHTSMLFGSYLDFLITSNEDPSLYYVIEDTKRPSEVIQTLLDQWLFTVGIKELELNSDLSFYLKELERFLKNKDFYPNLPIDNRVANFIKKGEEWWKFRIDNIEKSILSQKEASRMEFLHGKVKTSFLNNLLKKYEETGDLYFQKELYWQDTIRGYSFSAKGLCDILIVTEDQVVEIDVKFSSHKTFEGWIYGAKEMSYAIQKAYYYRGLRSNYKKPIKQYWLAVSDNFIHLVPCTESVRQQGLYGLTKISKYKVGDRIFTKNHHKNGLYDLVERYFQPEVAKPFLITEKEVNNLW